MDEKRRERISKLLSLMLRHKPEQFQLDLDAQGYALLDDVVEAARQKFEDVTREEILEVIDGQEKRRFEIRNDRVRARYGHSFPIDLGLDPIAPPEFLYFATVPAQVRVIVADGLKPGDRQYVHLSLSVEVASEVAKNRTETPVVFRISAQEAAKTGIAFYDRTPVFLAREIPPQFIEMVQGAAAGPSSLYGRRKRLMAPRPKPASPAGASEPAGPEP
jgi:putative RNA 2'-phosphotransferase